jgi:CRP/FNR family transcriptional regulator, cyclic AMP receptor protein
MVVEPCGETFKLVENALRSSERDCQVFHAKDAYEAMFKMKNAVPDLLLTDIELHKYFSGRRFIEQVLQEKQHRNIGVIVTAAAPDEEFCVNQVMSGQVQFVPRPFDLGTISKAITKALVRSKAQGDLDFQIRQLQIGEILFREGDQAGSTFLVKSGRLQACRTSGGSSAVLGEIRAGEFVGELAYINNEPRSADVLAVEPCELIEIPIEALDGLIFSKPAWAKALMKTLAMRVKTANFSKSG